mmetsp:Transcript_53173/g.106640  ORF Transcript_53173/g.106640 Transcript_53173/m.106640 type:complete len:583 (+) Transcript_53173:170-1918(+)
MLIPNRVRIQLLKEPAKRVVLSGPSGFLGLRVLDAILEVHDHREESGFDPGEIVLLSSSPGSMMEKLTSRFGSARMQSVRSSRVDYSTQHSVETWIDHLGSLGCAGANTVFVNIAGVAGPRHEEGQDPWDWKQQTKLESGHYEYKINYAAATAAASACQSLQVSHFIQSSTQATKTERAGQVPYSRGKMMADHSLSRKAATMPVTIARLGLLYCRKDMAVGQRRGGDSAGIESSLNLADLSCLPLTPVMGSGRALLQPQEVEDAALRLAFLALSNPSKRPPGVCEPDWSTSRQEGGGAEEERPPVCRVDSPLLRVYDAVGPETLPMVQILQRFARYQGNSFSPVYMDYRGFESVLSVKSLGSLNRQFVSLLRSEDSPKCGASASDSSAWDQLLEEETTTPNATSASLGEDSRSRPTTPASIVKGDDCDGDRVRLVRLDEAFGFEGAANTEADDEGDLAAAPIERTFPYGKVLRLALGFPRVIKPGFLLCVEMLTNAWVQGALPMLLLGKRRRRSPAEQAELFLGRFGCDHDVSREAVLLLLEDFRAAAKASSRLGGELGAGDNSFVSHACAVYGKKWNMDGR